jgi:hypothetical protein
MNTYNGPFWSKATIFVKKTKKYEEFLGFKS